MCDSPIIGAMMKGVGVEVLLICGERHKHKVVLRIGEPISVCQTSS